MSKPYFFSWVDEPLLAACAWPSDREELVGLREQGIDILITLTEEALPKNWIDSVGLMSVHVPVPDMEAPTLEQLDKCISVIEKARASNMRVAVHCLAGRGRTGTILAAYLVSQGESASNAMQRIRMLRPGSIEVRDQEQAITEYARLRAKKNNSLGR